MHPLANSPVVSGNTAFGIALLQKLAADLEPGENLFVSPYSVSQAALLAANGTKGPTQAAFLNSLQIKPTTIGNVNTDSQTLTGLLRPPKLTENGTSASSPAYELVVANAIWSRYRPKPEYIKLCARSYSADARPITTAGAINDWVSKKTRGRITQIAMDIHVQYSKLILTNAVYFKGRWVTPFTAEDTIGKPFYLPGGASGGRDQPFMHREDRQMRWHNGGNYEAVSLPYRGGMSMIVVLPRTGVSAGNIVSTLSPSEWQKMVEGFQPTWVALALPKFEIQYQKNLRDAVKSLGMPDGGDFSPISDRLQDAMIPVVSHRTFLRVDEEGSEAAAVTMMAGTGGPGPPKPKDKPQPFVVDRPFLCAIVHDATGAVLFLGMINDPKSTE